MVHAQVSVRHVAQTNGTAGSGYLLHGYDMVGIAASGTLVFRRNSYAQQAERSKFSPTFLVIDYMYFVFWRHYTVYYIKLLSNWTLSFREIVFGLQYVVRQNTCNLIIMSSIRASIITQVKKNNLTNEYYMLLVYAYWLSKIYLFEQ